MVYLKYAGKRNTAEKKRVTRMEKLQKTITELNDKLKKKNKTPEENLNSFMNASKILQPIR